MQATFTENALEMILQPLLDLIIKVEAFTGEVPLATGSASQKPKHVKHVKNIVVQHKSTVNIDTNTIASTLTSSTTAINSVAEAELEVADDAHVFRPKEVQIVRIHRICWCCGKRI